MLYYRIIGCFNELYLIECIRDYNWNTYWQSTEYNKCIFWYAGTFSSHATLSFVFSGNWNGTESVEEWDFLWRPRYDLLSTRFSYYVFFERRFYTVDYLKGCCSLKHGPPAPLGLAQSQNLLLVNLAAHGLCVFTAICFYD